MIRPSWFYAWFLPALSILDGFITYDAIKYHNQIEANWLYQGLHIEQLLVIKIALSLLVMMILRNLLSYLELKRKYEPNNTIEQYRKMDLCLSVAYWIASGLYVIINIAQGAYLIIY